jgi:hypothetical protein
VKPPCRLIGNYVGQNIPEGQQLIDSVVRPSGEFFQGIFQPSRRIKAIEFGGAEQALDGGGAFAGPFGANK